jgi:hypothetical protein
MPNAVFFSQFLVVLFSMMAGMFWLSAANGTHVGYPCQIPWKVAAKNLADHQAKWNSRAALCASVAAIAQALSFVFQYHGLANGHPLT